MLTLQPSVSYIRHVEQKNNEKTKQIRTLTGCRTKNAKISNLFSSISNLISSVILKTNKAIANRDCGMVLPDLYISLRDKL